MRNLFVAAIISTMLTAGAAMAMQADGPARAPMTKAQALARADARFDAMDTDKDGKLSAAEREAAAGAMRDRMGARQGQMAQRRGGGQAGGRMLARIDTNGDGVISREENRAGAEAAFARMDTNGNGTIDADERRGPQARAGQREQGKKMGRHGGGGARQGGIAAMMGDSNRDGTITRAEYDSQSAERFAMLDTNKDGQIDPAEIKARRDRMAARMPHRGNTPPSPAAPQGE